MSENTVRFRFLADDRVSGVLDRIRDKFDLLGGKGSAASLFGNVGSKAVAKGFDLISTAAAASIEFLHGSIEKASDLNETVSKSQVIFKSHASEIESWSNTMAKGFGQTKKQALDTASTFAGLFQSVGASEADAATKAKKLTELGSDLASFFNADVGDALHALQSGLIGEAEPLRRFNILLSDNAVEAKAAELGLHKVHGKLTESQKILARYQIILEQTGAAQGDFARTADGLANSQRILDAELENQQAILGQKLLPYQKQVTQWQIDFVEGLDVVIASLDKAADAWNRYGRAIAGVLFGHAVEDAEAMGGSVFHASINVGLAADSIGVDARDMRDSMYSVRHAAIDTEAAAKDLKQAIDDLTTSASDAATAFGDQQYSADELRGRMAELSGELRDAKKELRELEAIKHPTKDQQEDIVIARGKVADLRHQLFDTRVELAKVDATTLKGLMDELSKAQYRTDKLGDEAREALDLFRKLAYAQGKVTGSSADPGYAPRASGGPVEKGKGYLVGEEGPELFVPKTSGDIVPLKNASAMPARDGYGWSGDAPPVYVYLDGALIAEVVDRRQARDLRRAAPTGGRV